MQHEQEQEEQLGPLGGKNEANFWQTCVYLEHSWRSSCCWLLQKMWQKGFCMRKRTGLLVSFLAAFAGHNPD